MTNIQNLLNAGKSLGDVVGWTTVWNYWDADHLDNLAKKKGSNLHKFFEKMKANGEKGGFTMYVTCIGRSAHNASTIAVIRGITNVNEVGSTMYYSKRMGEIFIS